MSILKSFLHVKPIHYNHGNPLLRKNLVSRSIHENDLFGTCEENEVVSTIKRIVTCPANTHVTPLILDLSSKLKRCSIGWIYKFQLNCGVQVLQKLLMDTHISAHHNYELENAIVHCLHTIYSILNPMVEKISGTPNELILKSMLMCLISKNEETRTLASEIIQFLQRDIYPPSKILSTIRYRNLQPVRTGANPIL